MVLSQAVTVSSQWSAGAAADVPASLVSLLSLIICWYQLRQDLKSSLRPSEGEKKQGCGCQWVWQGTAGEKKRNPNYFEIQVFKWCRFPVTANLFRTGRPGKLKLMRRPSDAQRSHKETSDLYVSPAPESVAVRVSPLTIGKWLHAFEWESTCCSEWGYYEIGCSGQMNKLLFMQRKQEKLKQTVGENTAVWGVCCCCCCCMQTLMPWSLLYQGGFKDEERANVQIDPWVEASTGNWPISHHRVAKNKE